MKNVLSFLKLLSENNNKVWFDAHRSQWKEVQKEFNVFTSVRGLTIRDCTYRINRDTRFSNDKTPYKTHMGAFIAPKGKKSGYAGYYFHLEPDGGGFVGNSLMSAGVYCPEPIVLRSVRDEILDNGAELVRVIGNSNGFILNYDEPKLKRTPKGFPANTEFDEMLKLKNLIVSKPIESDFLQSNDLLERTIAEFKTTEPFLSILNRAIKFAYEEMM